MKLSLLFFIIFFNISNFSSYAREKEDLDYDKNLIVHKYFVNEGELLKISLKNLHQRPPQKITKLIKLKDATPLTITDIEYEKAPYLQDIEKSTKLPSAFVKMGQVVKIKSSYYQYMKIYPAIFAENSLFPISTPDLTITFSKKFSVMIRKKKFSSVF